MEASVHKHTGSGCDNKLGTWAFALLLIWEFMYFLVFKRAMQGDETLLACRIGKFLYSDVFALVFIAVMLIRALIVSGKKERIIRTAGIVLYGIYVFYSIQKGGYIFDLRNIMFFGLLLAAADLNDRIVMWAVLLPAGVVTLLRFCISIAGGGTDKGWIFPMILNDEYGQFLGYRFGYYNPNALPFILLLILIPVLYLLKDSKARYYVTGFTVILNPLVYYCTQSRAGFILVYFYLALYFLYPMILDRVGEKGKRLICVLVHLVMVICVVVTFIIASGAITDETLLEKLNTMFTYRITNMRRAWDTINVSLLGNLKGVPSPETTYLHTWLKNGAIISVIYVILHFVTVQWIFKKKEYSLLAIITVYDVYFLVDGDIFTLQYNLIIILMVIMMGSITRNPVRHVGDCNYG